MNQLKRVGWGTDEKGGSWDIIDTDTGSILGEIEITHTPAGIRLYEYSCEGHVGKSDSVPAEDTRSDEQLAQDINFTHGSPNEPNFRPME